MNFEIPGLIDVIDFFIVTIIFKYIIVHWIAERCVRVFKFAIVRSKDEAISWIHYSEGARGRGHKESTPFLCNDGYCKQLKEEEIKKAP